jgi:hypothetical protein
MVEFEDSCFSEIQLFNYSLKTSMSANQDQTPKKQNFKFMYSTMAILGTRKTWPLLGGLYVKEQW